jgi:hypothetical protein
MAFQIFQRIAMHQQGIIKQYILTKTFMLIQESIELIRNQEMENREDSRNQDGKHWNCFQN